MPNKITDEELRAAKRAFGEFYAFNISDGIMLTVLEAYESAKWRPGVPTEDGDYLAVMKSGARYYAIRERGTLRDESDGGELNEAYVICHQPFPEPPKEGK